MNLAQKDAHYGIRTHAGSRPADLESAALDRSAKCASDTLQGRTLPLILFRQLTGQFDTKFYIR